MTTQRQQFEAWAAKKWGQNAYRHTSACCGEWDAWQAAQTAHQDKETLTTAVNLAYDAGWLECACWAHRDDLISDIGSPEYLDDRMAHLDSIINAPRKQAAHQRICSTCLHFKPGTNPLVGVYESVCFECKHYYASRHEVRT